MMNLEKARRLLDPAWFVPRMVIRDRYKRRVVIGKARTELDKDSGTFHVGLLPAQEEFLRTWKRHRRILVLKSRQLGITTVTTLCFVHQALVMPHGYNTLTVTHEGEAVGSTNQMIRFSIALTIQAQQAAGQPCAMIAAAPVQPC